MSREIHFYESLNVIPDNVKVFHDWQSSCDVINKMQFEHIHTTQMCMLSTSLMINGYKVFVHQQNGVVYELHLWDKDHQDDYAVRAGQNLYGMWAANVFRVAKTVDDYVAATQAWGNQIVKYTINGMEYTAAEIPNNIRTQIVNHYKFHAKSAMVEMKTQT